MPYIHLGGRVDYSMGASFSPERDGWHVQGDFYEDKGIEEFFKAQEWQKDIIRRGKGMLVEMKQETQLIRISFFEEVTVKEMTEILRCSRKSVENR